MNQDPAPHFPPSGAAAAHAPPLRVRVSVPNASGSDHFMRLMPAGGFPGIEFSMDPGRPCDFLVVFWGLDAPMRMQVHPRNTLFLCGEPPGLADFKPAFMRQFAHWSDCTPRLDHPDVLVSPPILNPHLGLVDGEQRRSLPELLAAHPAKTELISVVCSAKSMLPGHRQRLAFVEKLKAHFGDRLHHFGRGFRPVPDKWDAIAPYRYHVAIENSRLPNYWTEKLSDAFLGLSFPFYSGAPNAGDFFPAEAFEPISIHDPQGAIGAIEAGIAGGLAEKRLAAMEAARTVWAAQWSPFAFLAREVRRLWRPDSPQDLVFWPERRFKTFPKGFLYGLRNRPAHPQPYVPAP